MAATHQHHVVNFELLKTARHFLGGVSNPFAVKQAFVPGADGGGGGGGGPPPAMDPGAMAGGGGPMDAVMGQLQQMQTQIQQLQAGGGGGMGGGGGKNPNAPKVDDKVVLMQILKTLARICDHMGIHVPMEDMVPGLGDVNQLAQASQGQAPMPGTPGDTTGAAGAGGAGAIPPVDAMQGMQPSGMPGGGGEKASSWKAAARKAAAYNGNGVAFDTGGLVETGNRASSIYTMRRMHESKGRGT